MQELQTHISCDNQSLMHDTGIVANKMLKTLLSHSTASSDEQQQKMITTTEVTDKQLNLRKILYETDRSNCDKEVDMLNTSQQTPSNNDNSHNDDDDRLVIDISDDEHSSSNNNNNNNDSNSNNNHNNSNNSTERSKGKSMPSLVDVADHEVYKKKKISGSEMPTASITSSQNKPLVLRQCSLPKSIYLNTSESGVKIDILTPISQPNQKNQSQLPFTSTLKSSLRESTLSRSSSSSQTHRASSPLTPHNELEMINNEIDLLFSQKSTHILKLLTEFISNRITRNIFENKMKVYCDITLTDLVYVTKNLIKKYKFEPNQNYKEFSKIKYLQFPTTYHNLVSYFDNILKTISQEQFLNILKLYEIIIKEMMNINKTKVIQYLLDFMINRKNMDLDMLNYNYKTNYAISMQSNDEQQVQYPDSTNNIGVQSIQPSTDDSFSYLSHNFCFIARSNPTWQTAKSQFITSVKSLCKTRMSSAEQLKRYEIKPFDNNHRGLKSRGAKIHSIAQEDDAEQNNIKLGFQKRHQQMNQHLQAALRAPPQQQQQHLQQQHQLQQQKQLQQQQQQLQQMQQQQLQQQQLQQQQQRLQIPQLQRQHSPVLIVDRSPPQTSPPYHHVIKIPAQIQVVPQQEVRIQRPILMNRDPSLRIDHIQNNVVSIRQNFVKSVVDVPAELTVTKPVRKPPPRRQTIHERQVIAEQPIALNLTPISIENVDVQRKVGKKIARRQSCHERTQMNTIERNCVTFLDEYESKVAENGLRELELAELKKQHQRAQELKLRQQKEQQKIQEEKQSYSIRPSSGQTKKAVRFNEDELVITNPGNYINNQPENLQRHYQAASSEQMDNHQRQLRFERMQAREISQYNSQMEQQLLQQQHQQQQQQQQQQHHIRERSPTRQTELMREHHPERHHSERHHSERQHSERHHSERHHSERHHQQPKQPQYVSSPTALQYAHENHQRNYERAVQQEQLNQQQNHREMVEDGSPVHLLQSHQQYVEQMKTLQQFNGRSQHHHHQQQPIQVRLSGPSRDEHQDRSPETLYYPQEIRQSPQTYQNTSSSSASSVTRMVSPQWQLPSREQSPIEYEQHDQHLTKLSLQRKTLMKVKNKTKYVEPNQNHNPFYHSAPLTYYANPYIFTRPQPTVESPSSVHNKNQTSFENPQNNSIPQLHPSIVHQTSYPPSQFPYYATQRFPLPPVPPFKEIAKQVVSATESGAPIHRSGYPDPPTDFLRKFYNKNNHF